VPQDNFEKELERLHRFGFRNFKYYSKLEEISLEGVVIIPLYKDPSIDPTEKENIKHFIIMNDPDSDKVGFLFYKTYSGDFPDDLLKLHPVSDYSTSITTISPNALNIARSIERSAFDTQGQ
jgi:hypothetical protein